MYKSQLQELCQKKSWSLPVYDSVKDGPDPQPFFTATVTVNDTTFESPIHFRSSKEAQNAAAQVALKNLSSPHPAPHQQFMISPVPNYAPSGSLPSTTNLDTKTAKRGEVEQKKDLLLLAGNPTNIEKGDGNTSETPNHFSTLKDAEHGAAKDAFESMSLHLTEEGMVFYKTLLQEHAQRKGLRFPIYDTQRSGPLHTPLFVSRVEIGDKSFRGQEATTKKLAELNAAKAAYICLTKSQKSQSSNYSAGETSEVSSFNLQPNVTGKVEEAVARKSNSQSSNFSGGKTLEVSALNLQPDVRGKLQELCQKKSWSLPVYDLVKEGPDHQPRFTATVTVIATFESPIQCRSSKEAQNAAAQVALNNFSSLPPAPQQQSMISPVPKYAPSEECLVIITVDGNTSETPNHFSTLKDAEHGPAEVAFESMSLHLTEEDKVLYKTLLQEHAQTEGLRFPIYDTQRSGPLHKPLFVSRVEIGDESFQGQEAKTKKMAEMNAAKAAFVCLTKSQKSQSSNYSAGQTSEVSSFNLQPNVTGKVEEAVARKSNSQSSNFSGGKTLEVSALNLQPDVRGKLQELCQKKSWSLPVYDSVKDGPDHQPRFMATVTVNDTTFESPIQCRSSKEAQNAAAQVALNNFASFHPSPQQQSKTSPVQKYAPSDNF